MTFILHMAPKNGRDFSIVIQSIGLFLDFIKFVEKELDL